MNAKRFSEALKFAAIRLINKEEIKVQKLSRLHKTDSFDCGDKDINDFLKNDALIYQEKKLAVTFIFSYRDEMIGFFCCSGDCVRLKEKEKKCDNLSGKNFSEIPAMKIGRLAIDKRFQKQGIGAFILKWAIGYVEFYSHHLGIRYVTVDAYSHKVDWYESHSFAQNLSYRKRKYVSMRFDLFNLRK